MKVLVLPDKFKGTLTARQAADAIAKGWRQARPGDAVELLPMSDGGDGFGEVMGALLNARIRTVKTVDAAGRSCTATWWWEPKTKTAVIESATVMGLAMLPTGKFHPFELDTFGLGAVINAAAKEARHCLMGIGGSATNDGGFGLARSLGWKFLDRNEQAIQRWIHLEELVRMETPQRRQWFDKFLVAVDVQNLLLGRRGATRVYGPQKGLRPEDFDHAERCLRRLAHVSRRDAGAGSAREAGSGAAGGLGFGLATFLGARLENGFDLFANRSKLERRLKNADLVITGEGAIDDSTLMGKGVGQIARRCGELKVPCIGLAGVVSARNPQRIFAGTFALTSLTTMERAKKNAASWLERLAEHAGQVWNRNQGG